MRRSFRLNRRILSLLLSLILVFSGFSQGKPDIKFVYNLPDSLRADTLIRLAKESRGVNIDLSLFYAQKAYEFAVVTNDSVQLGNAYNNIGNCNHLKGYYEDALKNYLKAIEVFENIHYLKGVASASINIGVLMADKGKDKEAIAYYRKASLYSIQIKNQLNEAACYNNIGICYSTLGNYDSSLFYAFRALEIRKTFEGEARDKGLITSYSNLAVVYMAMKNYKMAEKYYFMSLGLIKTNEDNTSLVECLNNIGDYYQEIGNISKSIDYLKQAEAVALKEKLTPELVNIYYNFSSVYKKKGSYKESEEYLQKYINIKDSLDNAHNREIVEEMQTKYETEKKDKEITVLNKDNQLKESQLEQEKKVRFFFIGFVLVVLVSTGLIYKAYHNKKKANELLKEKNTEIQHQKDLITEKNKEITDSIKYAKRLQEAILPPLELIKKYIPDSFVLYSPKDIVAGDFYWFHLVNGGTQQELLLAAADCTGHGVPGAMVSVVCSNALNSAVKEFELVDPGQILDKVNDLVEETFGESESDVKDGMDISLISLKPLLDGNFELSWAGANNPLWLLKNEEFVEIKANKQPVGKFDNRKPFTTHHQLLSKGDCIYLFTDGYADQFGGEKGKKFKYKQLSDLLISTCQLSAAEQQQKLQNIFLAWKGQLEQVDDITVIGLRL